VAQQKYQQLEIISTKWHDILAVVVNRLYLATMARGSGPRKPLAGLGNENGVSQRTRSAKSAAAEKPKAEPKKKSSNDSWETRENLFGTKNKRAWYRNLARVLRNAKDQVPGKYICCE
jgi:hypothetical protein